MVLTIWKTVASIARLIDVHEETVREWLRTGRLLGRNFGGRTGWRVKESDLNAFLSGHEGKEAAWTTTSQPRPQRRHLDCRS